MNQYYNIYKTSNIDVFSSCFLVGRIGDIELIMHKNDLRNCLQNLAKNEIMWEDKNHSIHLILII